MKSQFKDVPLIYDESLSQHVTKQAEVYGRTIAMIDASSGKRYSNQEFVTCVRSVGAALFHRGMRKGDIVCTLMPNMLEYPIIFHAVLSIGATIATANPAFAINELLYQLKDCKPKYLITVPEVLDKVQTAIGKDYNLLTVYVVGQAHGLTSFGDLLQEGSTLPLPSMVKVDPKEDVAVIAYSSGTTGLPKGVMLTHFALISIICACKSPELDLYTSPNTIIAFLPFFHIYGIINFLCLNFAVGDTMVIMSNYNLTEYLETAQLYQATFLQLAPPVAIALAKSPAVLQYNLSSVRNIICGGAPLSSEIAQDLHNRFPHVQNIKQGYGMTECVCHLGVSTEPYGNCGRIMPNTEVKAIDLTDGRLLEAGEAGELLVRGPQMMKGYLNKPQATAETIDKDGWLHTGDVVKYDREGNFFVVDRIKELIKYKGYQVPPAELEAVLLSHPDVADAAVVGLKDPTAGELPLAFVIRKPGSTISEQGIKKFVDVHVAHYKQLRGGVEFVKAIPKTASGKILRRHLRELANQVEKCKCAKWTANPKL